MERISCASMMRPEARAGEKTDQSRGARRARGRRGSPAGGDGYSGIRGGCRGSIARRVVIVVVTRRAMETWKSKMWL